jgi:hypothetical protein
MLAVDIMQNRRGMDEVGMNSVSQSGRHLYKRFGLELWSIRIAS